MFVLFVGQGEARFHDLTVRLEKGCVVCVKYLASSYEIMKLQCVDENVKTTYINIIAWVSLLPNCPLIWCPAHIALVAVLTDDSTAWNPPCFPSSSVGIRTPPVRICGRGSIPLGCCAGNNFGIICQKQPVCKWAWDEQNVIVWRKDMRGAWLHLTWTTTLY